MATQKIETGLIADDAVTSAKIGTLDANLEFGDSVKAIFGAGSDLQIYHDGTHSYIKDAGTGRLRFQASTQMDFLNGAGTETLANFIENGAVKLYYDNAEKLTTTSSGIDVTGTVVADGLTVQGAAANYNTIQFTSGSTGHGTIVNLGDTSDADYGSITQFATSAGEGGRMRFIAGTTETMNLRGGNVGIGESSPDTTLHIKKNQSSANSSIKLENAAGGNNSSFSIDWQLASSGTSAQIKADRTNSPGAGDTDLIFSTSTTGTALVEAMRIDYLGNVGIGCSPDAWSGYSVLQIGTAGSLSASEDTTFVGANAYSSATGWKYVTTDEASLYQQQSAEHIWYGAASGTADAAISWSERMRITSAGDLRVGTSSLGFHYDISTQLFSTNFGAGGNLTLAVTNSSGTGNGGEIFLGGSSRGDSLRNVISFRNGSSSEKLRIQENGGISFNGDTAAANALDDYEEGTFSVTVANLDGFSGSPSSSTFTYTKIGNKVFCEGKFVMASSSGNVAVDDSVQFTSGSLPFAPSETGVCLGTASVQSSAASGDNCAMGYVALASTGVYGVQIHTVNGTVTRSDKNISFKIMYETTA